MIAHSKGDTACLSLVDVRAATTEGVPSLRNSASDRTSDAATIRALMVYTISVTHGERSTSPSGYATFAGASGSPKPESLCAAREASRRIGTAPRQGERLGGRRPPGSSRDKSYTRRDGAINTDKGLGWARSIGRLQRVPNPCPRGSQKAMPPYYRQKGSARLPDLVLTKSKSDKGIYRQLSESSDSVTVITAQSPLWKYRVAILGNESGLATGEAAHASCFIPLPHSGADWCWWHGRGLPRPR